MSQKTGIDIAKEKHNAFFSVIDQPEVIKTILKHVGLWEMQKRPPPSAGEYSYTPLREEQNPSYDCIDPDYPFEAYL